MLIALGCVALVMIAVAMRFYEVSALVIGTTMVIGASILAASFYVFVQLDLEERLALFRSLRILPASPPDLVALTKRCERLIEQTGNFKPGTIGGIGAPTRQAVGQAWAVDWKAPTGTPLPPGAYGCSGEGAKMLSVVIAGVAKPLTE